MSEQKTKYFQITIKKDEEMDREKKAILSKVDNFMAVNTFFQGLKSELEEYKVPDQSGYIYISGLVEKYDNYINNLRMNSNKKYPEGNEWEKLFNF